MRCNVVVSLNNKSPEVDDAKFVFSEAEWEVDAADVWESVMRHFQPGRTAPTVALFVASEADATQLYEYAKHHFVLRGFSHLHDFVDHKYHSRSIHLANMDECIGIHCRNAAFDADAVREKKRQWAIDVLGRSIAGFEYWPELEVDPEVRPLLDQLKAIWKQRHVEMYGADPV